MKKVEDTIWKQIIYKLPQCFNFTLPSPFPQSRCVYVQRRSSMNRGRYHSLLPSDVIDFIIFFFAQLLLTCDPKVTNASTRERIRGTLQTSLYRQGKREVGAKGWSVKFRLSLGDIFVRFSQLLTEVESESLCSDPLVGLYSLNSELRLLTGLNCRNLPAVTVVFCSVSERCLAKVKTLYTQDIHLTFKCGGSFCTFPKLIVTGFKKTSYQQSTTLKRPPPHPSMSAQPANRLSCLGIVLLIRVLAAVFFA